MNRIRTDISGVDLSVCLAVISALFFFSGPGECSSIQSTRSEAMGGTRVQFAGEASSAFMNPGSLGSCGDPVFYTDFTGYRTLEVKGAAELRVHRRLNISLLTGYRESGIRIYGAGISGRVLSGTPDTYLNAGISVKVASNLEAERGCCGSDNSSEETGNLSAGLIFRPFPSFALRYIGGWAADSRYSEIFTEDDYHRAGITFYIGPAVIISASREFQDDGTKEHYGFSLRTGLPVEIMTGYNGSSVSGGFRLTWRFLHSSVVFSEDPDGGVRTRVSLEYAEKIKRPGT